MTKANQKILYLNFKKEAEVNKDPTIRVKCKKAAAEILKSFPEFKKETDSKDKEKK